jgi:hypothetical protein
MALSLKSEQKVQQPESYVQSPTVYATAETAGNAPFHKLSKNDTLISENQHIQLYLDKSTGTMKLSDKSNGYVWSSTPQDDKLAGLNGSWKEFAHSLIALTMLMRMEKSSAYPQHRPVIRNTKILLTGFV